MSNDTSYKFLVSPDDCRYYDYLKQRLKDPEHSTLALVGSGMSIPLGYSSWGELVRCLAESAEVPYEGDSADKLLRTAQLVYEKYRQLDPLTASGRFLDRVRKCLKTDEPVEASEEYSLLVNVNFSAFLTTNYDPTLSIALSQTSSRSESIIYDQHKPFPMPKMGRRIAYYLHGKLWEDDFKHMNHPIVFLPDEYEVAYSDGGGVSKFLNYAMYNYDLVFLGFGLRDPDFLRVVRTFNGEEGTRLMARFRQDPMRPLEGGSHLTAFIGLPDNEYAETTCGLQHDNSDVTLIHYKIDPVNHDHWGMRELLADLATAVPITEDNYDDAKLQCAVGEHDLDRVTEEIPQNVPAKASPITLDLEDVNAVLDAVKTLLSLDKPKESDVSTVLEKLKEPAIMDFASQFFGENREKLANWFQPLFTSRLITLPPRLEKQGEIITEDQWYGGRIISVAAELGLPGVDLVMRSITPQGPNATAVLLRSYASLGNLEMVAGLADAAADWISHWPNVSSMSAHDVASQAVALSLGGYSMQAALLVRSLLDFDIVTEPLSIRVKGKIDDLWVNHILHLWIDQIGKSAAAGLIEVLETQLRRIAEAEKPEGESYGPSAYLPFPMFIETIEEAGGVNSHLGEQIVAALRDLIDILIEDDLNAATSILERWIGDRILVFPRLGYYALSRYGHLMKDLEEKAVQMEHLDLWYLHHELWVFLNRRFGELPLEIREQIENWILEG